MKLIFSALVLFGLAVPSAAAFADSDDLKWIAQCLKDNASEGAATEVVQKYCTCMNNKMSSSETQSITQWEKSHPTEQKACDKEAGWK
jgi:hypothetical protein